MQIPYVSEQYNGQKDEIYVNDELAKPKKT